MEEFNRETSRPEESLPFILGLLDRDMVIDVVECGLDWEFVLVMRRITEILLFIREDQRLKLLLLNADIRTGSRQSRAHVKVGGKRISMMGVLNYKHVI